MSELPKDPVMLLSFVNMRLRDQYSSLNDLCSSMSVNKCDLEKKLKMIDYEYDKNTNQFI